MSHFPENITTALERMSDAFFFLDHNWTFVYLNKNAGDLAGKSPEELIGKNIWNVFPRIDDSVFNIALTRVLEQKEYACATGYSNPLGIWLEMHAYPAATGAAVYIRDITDKKKAEHEILKANRLYHFVSHVVHAIIKLTDEKKLFREVCEVAVNTGKFKMAWVGIIDEQSKTVIPVVSAGEESGYLSTIKMISVADVAEGKGPTGTSLREGRYVFCNNIQTEPLMKPWREEALRRGYYSSISLPLKKFGRVIGAFTMYAPVINYFNKEEIALLEEATGNISFALENIEREEMRKKAEGELIRKTYELNEKVKELSCLYSISEICNHNQDSIENILDKCVNEIPAAYHFAEHACARINFGQTEFRTTPFKETNDALRTNILVQGKFVGKLEVFNMNDSSKIADYPFLQDEIKLINSIAVLIGAAIERKKSKKDMLDMNRQLRQLSDYLQRIREDERTAVAREIHDELGQQLTVMKMDVSWLLKNTGVAEDSYRQRIEDLKSMLDQTVIAVRRIASELRPSMLDDMGLTAAIEWHLQEFEKRSGVKTFFKSEPVEEQLTDEMKTALFRIVQESLKNVARYAKAENVFVMIDQRYNQLQLIIRDDGVGFDEEAALQKKTLGILGMKERTHMMGGSYVITTQAGKGTIVTVKVPLQSRG